MRGEARLGRGFEGASYISYNTVARCQPKNLPVSDWRPLSSVQYLKSDPHKRLVALEVGFRLERDSQRPALGWPTEALGTCRARESRPPGQGIFQLKLLRDWVDAGVSFVRRGFHVCHVSRVRCCCPDSSAAS